MGFTTLSSSFRHVKNCQQRFQPKESLIIVTPEETGMFWRHITEEESVNSNPDTANIHLGTASLCGGSAGHLHFLSSNTGHTRGSSVRHQYRSTYFKGICSCRNGSEISTYFHVNWDGCQGGREGRSREMWINEIQEKNILPDSHPPPRI